VPLFAPSPYSDRELFGVVRDVCRHVDRPRARAVTQPQFDAARKAAGHPNAPSAQRICVRLKRGWQEVKEIALSSKRNVDQSAVTKTREPPSPWIGTGICVFALKLVAEWLGVESMTAREYDQAATVLRRERSRRSKHGRLLLPTSGQIKVRFGTWPKALKAAGLNPVAVRKKVLGMTYVDALELCLEETDTLATARDLRTFMQARQLILQYRERLQEGLTHGSAIKQLRARRAAAGTETPDGYTPQALRPDYRTAGGTISGPTRLPGVTDERCVQFLMRFLVESAGGKQTEAAYGPWSAATPGAPPPSTMRRRGRPGFAAMRTEAAERLRRGERPTV
jgi:hypothetical protein